MSYSCSNIVSYERGHPIRKEVCGSELELKFTMIFDKDFNVDKMFLFIYLDERIVFLDDLNDR